jgi:hypothetical protein
MRLALMTESSTCRHFSQSNPVGPEQGDVPALLRRVADSIEALGDVQVQDLVLHTDVNEDGDWHSLTVYFTADEVQLPRSRP